MNQMAEAAFDGRMRMDLRWTNMESKNLPEDKRLKYYKECYEKLRSMLPEAVKKLIDSYNTYNDENMRVYGDKVAETAKEILRERAHKCVGLLQSLGFIIFNI